MAKKQLTVIGAGISGLSIAALMAKEGFAVRVLEKNEQPGGRARVHREQGFTFDMGPTWYLMPEIFERFFAHFDKKVSDYYELEKLSPYFRVFTDDKVLDI
ncbi:MAG: phytoene desaturase, partial [Spirochaetae bacterium HGW-Spirochaetae-6]